MNRRLQPPQVLVGIGFLMLLLTSMQGWGMVGIIAVDGESTPSIQSSGTEDWFDSGWYFEGWRDYGTSVHSYVGTDKPSSQPHVVGMVTDLWSKWGGVPFQSSAVMQAQTESACVTGDRFAFAVLYYQ